MSNFKKNLYEIIFEADTRAGKTFDIVLLFCIILSVAAVMLESVADMRISIGPLLRTVEWVFTLLFTIEYGLRLYCVKKPLKYAVSFFGIVDLLAIIPTYISLMIAGTQSLIVIRALRLLRVFRVLKLGHYIGEANTLKAALKASRPKITVFITAILTVVVIIGTVMYMIEGEQNGFTSIPKSVYWAIVTMTTVGYGDIAPRTVFGQILASSLMIIGYSIIAIPTGIVSVEVAHAYTKEKQGKNCRHCSSKGLARDARFCPYCGSKL